MKRAGAIVFLCFSWLAPIAGAQPPEAGVAREIAMSASGTPQSPWVLREICRKATGVCDSALMNPQTGEVARMGDALGTDFERTGNGDEIRRVETAMDKAIRLKSQE